MVATRKQEPRAGRRAAAKTSPWPGGQRRGATNGKALSGEALIALGREVLAEESRALAQVGRELGDDFARAALLIAAAEGRLVVSGMGKAGFIAQKISGTFASTGTPSLFLHPADALHGDLGRVLAGDVLLVLSHSGETEEVVRLLGPVRQMGATILAMTASRESALGRAADLTLEMGRWDEAGTGLAPTTSTTVMLALGDALAVAVLKLRGFTEAEFRQFHPAGALARRMMRVGDVMRHSDKVPRVPPSASLSQVISVMTRTPGRPGAALVVDARGRLVGVFTDGDLRRLIELGAFALEAPVKKVMSAKPKTVRQDQYVTEAAAVLRQYAIDQVPVVDGTGRPVGLLDVQDLLAMRILS